MGVGWSDKTKVIPNSTQLKFKLKLKFEFGKKKPPPPLNFFVRHFRAEVQIVAEAGKELPSRFRDQQ